jgi:hypothetical protein
MNVALYDPNEFPETEVTQDFTLADVLAWARTKPADEEYRYEDSHYCAVAQFGRATGRPRLIGVGTSFEIDKFCPGLGKAAVSGNLTFGAFTKRLESALA